MAFFSSKDLPNVRPVADFNFAATKVLDNRINFSRGSGGTYTDELGVVRYAPHNVPRFDHDPTTGESLGLLVEETRTNKFTRSSTIGGTGWTQQGTAADYTPNTTEVAAPDGTFTALKWQPSSLPQYLYQNLSNIGTTPSTMSVWVRCQSGETGAFNMNLYSPTQSQSGFTATDQWQRFTWTFTPQSQANVYPIVPTTQSRVYYIWGPQLEEGAFATSYISTSGATEQRKEDRVVVKGEKFKKIFDTSFNSFSALVDYNNIDTVANGASNGVFHLWGETTGYDDRITVSSDNNTANTAVRTRGIGGGSGVFANSDALTASSQAATQKFAFSWSVPDYSNTSSRRWAFSFSGEDVDVVSDTTGTSVPQVTRLGLGINPTRLDEHGGKTHYKRVAIYNQVLTDEELKGLSAI